MQCGATRGRARDCVLRFSSFCHHVRVARREFARVLFINIYFFFIIQYGTRARMSRSGRNILFGRFYLLLKAGTFSQLTRRGKNELPFPDRFT